MRVLPALKLSISVSCITCGVADTVTKVGLARSIVIVEDKVDKCAVLSGNEDITII